MAKVPLLGGAYSARSVIANAQRCVNLYPEENTKDAEMPTTHYPSPGLVELGIAVTEGEWRGLYTATNGKLYGVLGASVYYIDSNWARNLLGTIGTTAGQVRMGDNGTDLVLVDGSTSGYTVTLSTNAFATIVDADFLGSDFAGYVDTYLIFNQPNSKNFYTSLSNTVSFDPLYIAAKTGYADKLVAVVTVHREIWLIGQTTTEVWQNVGGASFPFAIMAGVFIEHGCVAPQSIAQHDLVVFWLAQDAEGQGMVVMGASYAAQRISNHALEYAISTYSTISDAIGLSYQQGGHNFYQLTFPTADKTWVFDMQTQQWHEKAWLDSNGAEHRHRANCGAFAYGVFVVGDFENGKLYELDPEAFTDAGDPVIRIRGFPHLVDDGKRVNYSLFAADMECGTIEDPAVPAWISLRWSDDRGKSWGNQVLQSMGETGEFSTQPTWQQLGIARDRVFELSWSINAKTALNGAYVDALMLES